VSIDIYCGEWEILARTADDFNPVRLDHLLELARLADSSNRRVSEFSTGMKQRLGVASSLLNDPDLIILDRGELVQEGAVSELLGLGHQGLRLQATPLEAAADNLREKWSVTVDGLWLAVSASSEEAPEIVKRLVDRGIDIRQVIENRQTLEELFMEATDPQNGEG
jgi:ABC-type multidrug transport system ATPase subunit